NTLGPAAPATGRRAAPLPDPGHAGVGSFQHRHHSGVPVLSLNPGRNTMTSPPNSYAILGAGLMGRLLAVALAHAGHPVATYDRGGPEGEHSAARAAGGMLAPLAESAVTEHGVVRMGRYALTRWRELLGTLARPVFF